MTSFTSISPIDNSIYVQEDFHTKEEIEVLLNKAKNAEEEWKNTPLLIKQEYIKKFLEIIMKSEKEICLELAKQMGRPISHGIYELKGFNERAQYLLNISEETLKNKETSKKEGFERYIQKLPLGTIALLSPWNYPYLTSVNILIPALLAGNCVLLKHSTQTPLVALRYKKAFEEVGLPAGVFDIVYLNHDNTHKLLEDKRIDGVFFTGSVKGGLAVQEAIKDKFIPCGLELGGKDPAYVREDAHIDIAVDNLVEGSFFNAGQSCCAIERIYVDEKIYDNFVKKFVEKTSLYILGNPCDKNTNLGPMVSKSAARYVREEINKALKKGAKSLVSEHLFSMSEVGTAYLSPHVLVDVTHEMSIMKEESFGPVVGIMKVGSDEEALKLMNDSAYGLTASLWSKDIETCKILAKKLNTGTVFLNRCDYLDPELAWTGVKNTGRGVSLSPFVYDSVTRLKSFHFKL